MHRPRWGFFKGFLTGAVIEVPILAATVWVLARLGIGNPDTPFMRLIRLTAVFAGIAAVLTAAGVGRLAAYATIDGGRRRAIIVATRAHAAASIGLVIIAAVPHGQLPETHVGWLAYPIAGALAGALTGALIGAVCGGAAPVTLGDVLSLARRPTDALRQFVDPEDLLRVGSRLRARTTHLFEGLFEPGPKPPKADGRDLARAATPPHDGAVVVDARDLARAATPPHDGAVVVDARDLARPSAPPHGGAVVVDGRDLARPSAPPHGGAVVVDGRDLARPSAPPYGGALVVDGRDPARAATPPHDGAVVVDGRDLARRSAPPYGGAVVIDGRDPARPSAPPYGGAVVIDDATAAEPEKKPPA